MTEAAKQAVRLKEAKTISSLLVAIVLVCALVLSGCGSSTAAKLSQSVSSTTAMAMVTAVNGNTVTVQVMEGAPGGQPGSDADQQSGDKQSSDDGTKDQNSSSAQGSSPSQGSDEGNPAGGNGEAPNGTPPEKPSGDNSQQGGEPPAGNPPSGAPGAGNNSSDSSKDSTGSKQGDGQSLEGQGAPDGKGGPGGGTEMTLTISDESIIYTNSDGTEAQGSLSDIAQGTMLMLSVSNGTDVTKIVVGGQGGPGDQGAPGGQGGPGQGSSTVKNGTGATTFDSDDSTSGKTYNSTSTDENAARVENGATVTLDKTTVTKSGDSSSAEDSDFYGLNAGILAYDGSNLTVTDGSVSTESQGSNGIFAYGEGTQVSVSDTKIRTTKDNSGGIEVAGGATLTAKNLDVDTQGTSSAAIRSDRGGGTETVSGGTYTTHGKNSPAVYSTADVTVEDADLTAENSEGIVIEGKNSVTLKDTDLTGNVNGTSTRTGVSSNVMIYQSMSGDASEGTGSFKMAGGTFTATHGTVFYVTNTEATIDLSSVDIKSTADALLTVAGNDGVWGTSGSNGGKVTFAASKQKLSGAISVDDASSLTLELNDSSSYEGAINSDGQQGTVSVALEEGSTWKLTGDSYISELSGNTDGIDLNGHTLYVNGKAWSK